MPEENELQIQRFLKPKRRDRRSIKHASSWLRTRLGDSSQSTVVKLFPNLESHDGFFIACLKI